MNRLKADWLEVAKALPYGKTTRIVCCGKDASALVSHGRRGYSKYCFRCAPEGNRFVPHDANRLSDILARRNATNESAVRCALPSDFTQDFPSPAVVWLAKASVSVELAKAYGVGYSPSQHRVILPTYADDGSLQYIQARALDAWQKPKYVNIKGTAVRSVVAWSKPSTMLPSSLPDPDMCVLTEDMLSMFRVGRLQHAASLLGTGWTTERVVALLGRFQNFIIWLDPDNAGVSGSRSGLRQLQLHGAQVRIIRTDRDPKYYTNEQIAEVLRTSD